MLPERNKSESVMVTRRYQRARKARMACEELKSDLVSIPSIGEEFKKAQIDFPATRNPSNGLFLFNEMGGSGSGLLLKSY